MSNITSEVSCTPTYNQLVDVIETGLCDQSFQGIFTIWIGQYLSVSLMLLVTILAVFLDCQCMNYFWLTKEEIDGSQEVVMRDTIANPTNEVQILYSTTSKNDV
jgi:hypothetical protein